MTKPSRCEGVGLIVAQHEIELTRHRSERLILVSSDMIEVALPLLGRDEAMAGGGLGSPGGREVLDEGRSEELLGRRTARSKRSAASDQIVGEGAAHPASRPSAGGTTGGGGSRRSSIPQSAAPRNMARQWCGLVSAPGIRSSRRAARGWRGHDPQGAAVGV